MPDLSHSVHRSHRHDHGAFPHSCGQVALYQLPRDDGRKSTSSLQLAKEAGITQKSAWFLLQRIRQACGKTDDDDQNGFLQGIMEADETHMGVKEVNKHEHKTLHAGRGAVSKIPILEMRECGRKVRGRVLSSTDAAAIQTTDIGAVTPGSTLYTDERGSCIDMHLCMPILRSTTAPRSS